MAWFYAQTHSNPGVDPVIQNDTRSGHLEEKYQFFQVTDPKAIQLYTFLTGTGGPGGNGVTGLWGPYDTLAEAQAVKVKNAPTDPGTIAQNITGGGNLFGLGDAFNANITQWLIRIGEIALGIVLIAVAFAKLTGIDNKISTAAKVVTKV